MATPVTVNVLDYGAVADGVTDCAPAFRNAMDALDPRIGGTVVVPPSADPYMFNRSVIVDRENVRFVGDNPTTTVLETRASIPPLIFGVQRGLRGSPMNPAHWQDLSEVIPGLAAGRRWGYRTIVPLLVPPGPKDARQVDGATVTLPASPFALGPADGHVGWTGMTQFTIDFTVAHNTGPWPTDQTTALFGAVDTEGLPSPFLAWLGTGVGGFVLVFDFVTEDGLWREIRLPIADPSQSLLRCSLQFDLHTGAVAAWINHARVTPDLSFINDGWGERPVSLARNKYSPFNLGMISPNSCGHGGAGVLPGGVADLTFGAMRLSSTLQYVDAGADDQLPQRTAAGTVQDSDWWTSGPGVFACLPMNEPAPAVSDLQVPWQSSTNGQVGFGLFVSTDLGNGDTISGNSLERLTVNCGRVYTGPSTDNYGQAIAVGFVYTFRLTDVIAQFGAQGLSSYNFGVSYPVELRQCQFSWQSDAAIYSYGQIARGDEIGLAYYGNAALKAVRSTLTFRNVFCTDSATCESVVRTYEGSAQFDSWIIDFEGAGANVPSDSYFWASLGSDVGPTQLVFRDCQVGTAGPEAVAVRLVGGNVNAGLPTASRNTGWCTIERSFNTFFDRNALGVVAVDGPLWQGTFQGPAPARPELVLTTASPGASARIGLNGPVPPAVTVPRPTTADPIPDLPGLIGYYQVDALRLPIGNGAFRYPNDGEAITSLTDLSQAHNDGTAVQTAPVYVSSQVNGRAALRFNGSGWYSFPQMHGTTGGATIFLVTKGNPVVDTAPGRASLRRYGLAWSANILSAPPAGSNTDWVVYTTRYTAGAKRVLDLWANGRHYDSRRRDNNGDIQFATPLLGSVNNGLDVFAGQVAAAVFVDGGLADDQVDLVNRFLLHQHDIPV